MTSLITGSDRSLELPAFTAAELAQLLHPDPSAPVQYPTLDQTRIIEAPLEPMLVIAGAGSGKTKTMADRVVWLVANGYVRPEQVLGVTFTRKASGELSTRIRQRLAALYRVLDAADGAHPAADRMDPSVSTYHSYSNGIVQDYGLRIGVERDAVMLGTAQAWQLASNVVERYQGSWEHLSAAKSTLVKAVLGMASECAEHLVTPADVRAGLEEQITEMESLSYVVGAKRPRTQAVDRLLDKLRTRVTVAHMVDLYSAAKSGGRQLDFGDLVALAARIVSEVPEAVELEREKYNVVLLDEFQDTSFAQMVLFSKLFGDGRAVTSVGDPHQSIYGFRGASAGQLGTFRTRFPLSNNGELSISPMSNLSVAWRNATSILAAANTVAAPLNRPAAWLRNLPRQEVPDLQPRPGAPVGEVYLGRFLSETTTASTGGDWTGPQPGGQNNRETGESAALAELVQRHRSRSFEKDALGRPLRPTVAVLCRGRRQFEPVRRELANRGIPVQIVGLGGLLRTPEIVELLAVLKVLGDPERSDAMFRLLAGARWRIGPADLMALGDWAKHLARERSQRLGRMRTVSTAENLGQTVVGGAANTAPQSGPTPPQAVVAGTAALQPDASEAGSLVEAIDHLPPQ
ncbi:ATP-dependent helicase, partial [Arthrobacter sp. H5]|uniref:ATP-dependent helicase n=1 Tax=Arthrobacter sp. H5 TaxID=1267973 RepID=UPI0005684BB7